MNEWKDYKKEKPKQEGKYLVYLDDGIHEKMIKLNWYDPGKPWTDENGEKEDDPVFWMNVIGPLGTKI